MQANATLPSAQALSFKDFVFRNKPNRLILLIVSGLIIAQFSIFKYLYPYASYIHGDSFSYLDAAHLNLDISTYPIGYSRFLRLFSVFFRSDIFLVAFQYLCIQGSAMFLLFTLFYFYTSGKITQYVLLGFMVLNPLFWHLANLVSSDCLFAALSITWFALLLWIIHRPSTKIIVWHTVVLFIAFTFRYNALIYPSIAVVAFWISKLPLLKKIAGVAASVLLCGLFVCYTSYKYKQLSGSWQFSPFSGWLMANNAMYAYRHVDSADRKPVPKKYQALDNMIRTFYDNTRDTKKFPSEEAMASTFYMWSPGMPLMKYRDSLFRKDTTASELKKWSAMGPFYKSYGIYIIRQYPWHYAKYYTWPGARKYYAPPVEFLENFNSGSAEVTDEAKIWFGYKSKNIKTRMTDSVVWVLNFYPILSGIINIVMLFVLLFYVALKGWRYYPWFGYGVLIGSTVWLLNAGFTIGASSAALRFQSFPILLTTIFVVLLIDWMMQLLVVLKREEALKVDSPELIHEKEPQTAI